MDDIGLDVWESSRILCDHMVQNDAVRRLIRESQGILELGAGLTFVPYARKALAIPQPPAYATLYCKFAFQPQYCLTLNKLWCT